MNAMDLRDLAYFEAIATIGHLGRAAERLGRSQPALSKCIDRLESQIGAKLFESHGRGLRLTETGHVLLEQARVMRRTMDESVRRLAEHARGAVGSVRLGVSPAAALGTMPRLLERLLCEAPQMQASVIIESSDRLRTALRDSQIDIIVGPTGEDDNAEFVSVPLTADLMVVSAREGHPLAGQRRTLEDLVPYRWLQPGELVASRRWLDRMFERRGLATPAVQVEANATLFLRLLVERTDLLTFISRRDLGPLREIEVPELVMQRSFGAVHRRAGYLSPLVRRVLAILADGAADIFRG